MNRIFDKLKALIPNGRNGKLIGQDPFGNKYFEQLGAHAGGRSRRLVVLNGLKSADNMSPHFYSEESVPVQWRAWLSHSRHDIPSKEEILADIERIRIVRERAKQLELKYENERQQLLQKEHAEHARIQEEHKKNPNVVEKVTIDFETVLTRRTQPPLK